MGNCLNAASKQQHDARRRRGERVAPEDRDDEPVGARSIGEALLQDDEEYEEDEEAPEAAAAAGMKVKVVLTRAELEWLMAQLKSGEQRLEDVLRQMGAARSGDGADDAKPRAASDGWRPRLECIVECHEPAADAT